MGVVMLRKLLDEQIAVVEAGGEPMAIPCAILGEKRDRPLHLAHRLVAWTALT